MVKVVVLFFRNWLMLGVPMPLAKRRKKTWPLDEKRFRKHCNSIANIKYNELTVSHIMKLHLTMGETKYKGEYYAPAICNRVLYVFL